MSTVNNPQHYNQGPIETIDSIESVVGDGFSIGCVIKYVSRYRFKDNPLEDLNKAQWYLQRLIKNEELRKAQKNVVNRSETSSVARGPNVTQS